MQRPRVALIIETSRAYGRGLLKGIIKYVQTRQSWITYHQERGLSDESPVWLDGLKIDGLIARADSLALCTKIEQLKVPTVDLRGLHKLRGIPLIETNDRRVIRLAFDHLREREFSRFAFCGFPNVNYSDRRLEYAKELAATWNIPLHIYGEGQHRQSSKTVDAEEIGVTEGESLTKWIKGLPTPIGIVCCNDIRGRQVLDACNSGGVHVPDEVAVVGVDNDEILCGLGDPALSSVEPDTERIGFRAAEILANWINGHAPTNNVEYVEPVGVVSRRSSDAVLVEDPDLAMAIRIIRDRACHGITVTQLVRMLPISRTVLEKRFQKHLQTSPKLEINRVRLIRIKQLLRETDDTLTEIASATGFRHPEYMNEFFKCKTGDTPGAYRQRNRN